MNASHPSPSSGLWRHLTEFHYWPIGSYRNHSYKIFLAMHSQDHRQQSFFDRNKILKHEHGNASK